MGLVDEVKRLNVEKVSLYGNVFSSHHPLLDGTKFLGLSEKRLKWQRTLPIPT
jgi:hypothetical protein